MVGQKMREKAHSEFVSISDAPSSATSRLRSVWKLSPAKEKIAGGALPAPAIAHGPKNRRTVWLRQSGRPVR